MASSSQAGSSPDRLSDLDKKFASISNRVGSLGDLINPRDIESLFAAAESLKGIIMDLQAIKDDPKLLAGMDERDRRLRNDVQTLLEQSAELRSNLVQAISVQISELQDGLAAATSTVELSTNSEESDDADPHTMDSLRDEPPLKREEAAKLLLLISKAFGLGKLTARQRTHLKEQVSLQLGYLRVILQQSQLQVIFSALVAVSGDP